MHESAQHDLKGVRLSYNTFPPLTTSRRPPAACRLGTASGGRSSGETPARCSQPGADCRVNLLACLRDSGYDRPKVLGTDVCTVTTERVKTTPSHDASSPPICRHVRLVPRTIGEFEGSLSGRG